MPLVLFIAFYIIFYPTVIIESIFKFLQWLPESARYHVASGQPDKALETLQKVNEGETQLSMIVGILRQIINLA